MIIIKNKEDLKYVIKELKERFPNIITCNKCGELLNIKNAVKIPDYQSGYGYYKYEELKCSGCGAIIYIG